jgi:hypothetical protein
MNSSMACLVGFDDVFVSSRRVGLTLSLSLFVLCELHSLFLWGVTLVCCAMWSGCVMNTGTQRALPMEDDDD